MANDLRGWITDGNGDPRPGVTVTYKVASNAEPNGNSIIGTDTTDASGMWEFTGVAGTANYDVYATDGTVSIIYKGNSSIPHAFGNQQISGSADILLTKLHAGSVTGTITPDNTAANLHDRLEDVVSQFTQVRGGTPWWGSPATTLAAASAHYTAGTPHATASTFANAILSGTPTITNYTNAPHNHGSAAAGGLVQTIGCVLASSATQVIPNGSETALAWDTESEDASGMHSGTAAAITIPTGFSGWWSLTAAMEYQGGTASSTTQTIAFVKNSSSYLRRLPTALMSTTSAQSFTIDWKGRLAAGDTVDVRVSQNTGGTLHSISHDGNPQFAAVFHGS